MDQTSNFGIKMSADGSELIAETGKSTKAQADLGEQIKKNTETSKTAAEQTKGYAEQLKSQANALDSSAIQTKALEQITGRMGGTLGSVARAGGIYGAAIVLIGGALYEAVKHSETFERSLGRMDVALIAHGNSAALSHQQLAQLTKEIALLPTMSGEAAVQVVAAATRMRGAGGAQIQELSRITVDYATATGQVVPDAAAKLVKAFEDPAKGALELDKQLNILSVSQLMSIQRFTAHGDTVSAQKVLFEALHDRVDGLTTRAMTPLESSIDRLTHAWPALAQRMSDGEGMRTASGWFAKIVDSATWLVDHAEAIAKAVALANPAIAPTALAAMAMGGGQPAGPTGSQGDVRRVDNEYTASLQAQAKAGLELADSYDKIETKRRALVGAGEQLNTSMRATTDLMSLASNQELPALQEAYARQAAGLKAVNAELAKLDEGKDALNRYLTVAIKLEASAQESISTTEKKTQAQKTLAAIEELYRTGQVQGTEATMQQIRATLGSADAYERMALNRQRDIALSQEAVRAANEMVKAWEAEGAAIAAASHRLDEHVQSLETETRLMQDEAARIRASTGMHVDRYKQIEIETRLSAEASAEREKAIAFRQIENDYQKAMINATPDEIAAIYALIDAEKARAAEAIDSNAAARQNRDAAQKTSREWNAQFQRTSDNIERGITDSIIRGFDKGKSFMENFKDSMVNTFKTAILTPIIQPIVRPIANAISGMVQSAMGGIFGGGGGGGLFGGGGGFGGGMDMAGGLGGLFGGGTYAAGSGIAEEMAALGIAQTGGMGAMGALGTALPWVGAGLFAANAMGLFGGGGGPKDAQIGLIRGSDGNVLVSQNNIAGGGLTESQALAMDMKLRDPAQYDQAILGQSLGMIGGSAGEGLDSMLQKLQQALQPAHDAALKVSQDQLATQQQQLQQQQQLTAQQGQLSQAMLTVASGLSQKLGIDSLQSATNALATSDFNAPLDRFDAAKQQVSDLFGQAMGGDLAAVQNFPQLVQSALGIGRDVFASGPQFQDFFLSSNRMLNDLLAHQRDVQTEIMRDMPVAIQQASHDQVAEIRAQTQAMVAALNDVKAELVKLAA